MSVHLFRFALFLFFFLGCDSKRLRTSSLILVFVTFDVFFIKNLMSMVFKIKNFLVSFH